MDTYLALKVLAKGTRSSCDSRQREGPEHKSPISVGFAHGGSLKKLGENMRKPWKLISVLAGLGNG